MRIGGGEVSRFLPPWLLMTIPSHPSAAALIASSALIMPLITIFPFQMLRSQERSSQLRVSSIKLPMILPRLPPNLSLTAVIPVMGDCVLSSALTRSSASLLPAQGASTVRKMDVTFGWFEDMVESRAEVSERFLWTYSWKKNGYVEGAEERISVAE